jgi:tyrosine-protein kinase Etk/Wzc
LRPLFKMNKKTQTQEKSTGLIGVKKHLLLIGISLALGIGLMMFFYLVCPKYYKSTTTILQPPEKSIKTEREKGQFSEEFLSQIRTNTELFFSILKSRRMKDNIIKEFGLKEVYKSSNIDQAREELERKTTIALTENKMIEISVIDENPERAAMIANYYTDSLNTLVKSFTVTTAKQDRMFIEKRLDATVEKIKDLEERLNLIQRENDLVADENLSQLTETAGNFMEMLFEKQLYLSQKSEKLNENDFEIKLLKAEIKDINDKLSGLLKSKNELTSIIRQLKVQKEVYSFLTSKLEEAQINEAKDTPVVQVLDKGVVPNEVNSPNLLLMVLVTTGIIGGAGLMVLFFDLLKYLGSI